jgi:choline dehydrogenase-like flavoprotein
VRTEQDAADRGERSGTARRTVLGAAIGAGAIVAGAAGPAGTAGRAEGASPFAVLTSPDQLRAAYDHVIVGAGSAGCVLAYRLGRAGRRVLVIEAGGVASLPAIADPPEWPELQGSAVDWRYVTTPQPGLGGRVVTCPRGKVLGGSSAINALAYQRGHHAAYDQWPEGWRFSDLLPYFRRAETFSGGADAWHGGDGPLHVLSLAGVADRTPVAGAFIAAAREHGFPYAPDIGGATPVGAAWNQLSIRDGVRDDAATAYLGRADGAAVDVLVGERVVGLAMEGGRCAGARLRDRVVRPGGDVLLCAGAIDSPRLLMLAGLGPADELKAHGIPVMRDLPGVGRNLEDHLLVGGVAYAAKRDVARSHYNHADSLLYVPRGPDVSPELLVMCLSLPFVMPAVGTLAAPAYVLVPCLMRPRSRGNVRLASGDPLAPALIDPNYLGEPDDLETLADGVALARDLGAAKAFDDWRAREVYPGAGAVSRADLRAFVLQGANSFHHPVGTCRMGEVVDTALRVEGVAGLRVVDASVFPSIPQAMVNAATIAVAERASDLVLSG